LIGSEKEEDVRGKKGGDPIDLGEFLSRKQVARGGPPATCL
jgi:hypothetical protein